MENELIEYKSILKNIEIIYKIKRSEFIGNSFYVKSEIDAKEKIKEISFKYKNATHNCWAYKIGKNFNYSDNGEPSGTAGKPILGSIEKYDLNNILIIVTRYFGGIKLGVRGLIDAYSETAEKTIISSKIAKYKKSTLYRIKAEYSKYSEIERMLKRYDGWNIKKQTFSDYVVFEILINDNENIFNILKNKSKEMLKIGIEEIPTEVKV
ncbi:hypothetical protein OSSY52_14610 [Tepiditoga spiralis]|uniref:Impact N-terminal domain-containing protein n=1 Tax=Tepiditoga spiralis TaxID=2108365 RepID=A0A7G1G4A0_9BACT|nr:YigZ family protein [Tepiditoga spiralis]BBE31320.1 hypothetical protein OSSY52_14610 [Tepiditoga spiralis]